MKAINWRFLLPLVLFIALAYFVLGMYSDMLYTAQDRNTFFTTSDFFCQTVKQPFGLMTWLGGYLTQFFFNPALGTSMLIAVWAVIYIVSYRVFRTSPAGAGWLLLPLGCLLASITDVGYWVYTMNLPGYWFSQSVAYLLMLLMLMGAQHTPSPFRLAWFVVAWLLYPVLGWVAQLFAVCLGLGMIFATKDEDGVNVKPWWREKGLPLLAIALTWLPPYIWRALLYSNMNMRDIMHTGFPFFESNTTDTMRTTIPFIFLIGFTLWLSAFAYRKDSWMEGKWAKRLKMNGVTVPILAILLCIGGVWKTKFNDYNFQAEMRMNRMAMEDDWTGIIEEAGKTNTPSRSMVMLRNIALLNTGELGNRAFAMNSSGEDIFNPDSMNLNIMQIASPMVYYNHGKVNYAYKWCMEFGVYYGLCPYYLKMMMRCAQATGEEKLYKRYETLLGHTSFYGNWKPKPTSEVVKGLKSTFLDVIDSDNNNMESYLIENYSMAQGAENKYVKELNLFYSMVFRDSNLFWPAFHSYAIVTQGKNIPLHYQEAYLEISTRYPVQLPYEVEIDPNVRSRHQSFTACLANASRYCNNDYEQMKEMLHDEWQYTYWYYLYFGRKAY